MDSSGKLRGGHFQRTTRADLGKHTDMLATSSVIR